MFTDGEILLVSQNRQDRRYAAQQIHIAKAEIRRLASIVRHLQAELDDAQADLKTERAARMLAEYNLNKRH